MDLRQLKEFWCLDVSSNRCAYGWETLLGLVKMTGPWGSQYKKISTQLGGGPSGKKRFDRHKKKEED